MWMCGAGGVNEGGSLCFEGWDCWSALLRVWIALVDRDKKAQVRGADLWRAT